jgi:hypothetical protein
MAYTLDGVSNRGPTEGIDHRLFLFEVDKIPVVGVSQYAGTCYLHAVALAMEVWEARNGGVTVRSMIDPFVLAEAMNDGGVREKLIEMLGATNYEWGAEKRESEFFNDTIQRGPGRNNFLTVLDRLGFGLSPLEGDNGPVGLSSLSYDGNGNADLLMNPGEVPVGFVVNKEAISGQALGLGGGEYVRISTDEKTMDELFWEVLKSRFTKNIEDGRVPLLFLESGKDESHTYVVIGANDMGVTVVQAVAGIGPDRWAFYKDEGFVNNGDGTTFIPGSAIAKFFVNVEILGPNR